jgi:hypothetical protein
VKELKVSIAATTKDLSIYVLLYNN